MRGVTPYQLGVLKVVVAAAPTEPIDLDQMLEQLAWAPTKESTQFVIRSLVTKGLIEKTELVFRRGRRRVCYRATPAGLAVLDPRAPVEPVPGPSAETELIEKVLTETGSFEVDPGPDLEEILEG